jgi:hypothetical protein
MLNKVDGFATPLILMERIGSYDWMPDIIRLSLTRIRVNGKILTTEIILLKYPLETASSIHQREHTFEEAT